MVLAGHSLVPWKSAESLRQQRPVNNNITTASSVLTTNTVFKDYDPTTGNKIINGKYMIIRELGRGVHGKVKLAQSLETNELVAIKIVDKRTRKRQLSHAFLRPTQQVSSSIDEENEQKIRREIAILKKCVHPHVVQLMEIMEDPESSKIYMVLEYMNGGEIEWRDEQDQPVLDINHARSIFRDVVSGLDYLHYQGVIHRDIKPANLLYSKDHVVKISDFGVSYFNKILAGEESKTMEAASRSDQVDRELAETAGTPAFFAPELCWAGDNRQDYRHRITRSIDVWALGVTLYCFIFGQCPFIAATEYELFEVIPTQPVTFPRQDRLDDQLKDLLLRLLEKNPQERITLEQVKCHPWVIQDLPNPELWWAEADPRHYQMVSITDDDVSHAYTIMDRLRRSIHKLSSSFSHLTQNITRRRAKSSCQTRPVAKQIFHANPASRSSIISTTTPPSSALLPLSPPPTTTTMLFKSERAPSITSSSNEPYPISTPIHPTAISSDSDHYYYDQDGHPIVDDEIDDDNIPRPRRCSYQRNNSSASSMSGLVVTFSKHRETASNSPPPVPPLTKHHD
ncbi:kinase-like domain-containing protein [Halteromyces radiatus]|uniref:kinase-like domain-containing protein n=1 Tax=Halteromyces radiatus TaxID=101107 RepID=UPI00221FF324|nr:kinase-like domain-containing protein [Halteromyces radiatus]KAI8089820.1 kinase-like domain-containing protein [Halteromyces radiatus]